jgi:hypothetical protein
MSLLYTSQITNMENTTMRKLKKIPFQIYLEPEQDKIITLLAKSTGKSKAAVIRLCISKYLASIPPEKDPALGIMNLGASGKKDIAEKHDDYLNLNSRAASSGEFK